MIVITIEQLDYVMALQRAEASPHQWTREYARKTLAKIDNGTFRWSPLLCGQVRNV